MRCTADHHHVLDTASVCDVLDQAFTDLLQGNASVLARQRIGSGDTQFSFVGGIWELHHVAGTKSYTTRRGQINFVVTLIDIRNPSKKTLLEGDVLTRIEQFCFHSTEEAFAGRVVR